MCFHIQAHRTSRRNKFMLVLSCSSQCAILVLLLRGTQWLQHENLTNERQHDGQQVHSRDLHVLIGYKKLHISTRKSFQESFGLSKLLWKWNSAEVKLINKWKHGGIRINKSRLRRRLWSMSTSEANTVDFEQERTRRLWVFSHTKLRTCQQSHNVHCSLCVQCDCTATHARRAACESSEQHNLVLTIRVNAATMLDLTQKRLCSLFACTVHSINVTLRSNMI